MSANPPISSEIFQTKEQASQRVIKQLGGRIDFNKSMFNKWIYWCGRDRVWAAVTVSRGGYKVELFKGCPC